jgi:hypothetical protein
MAAAGVNRCLCLKGLPRAALFFGPARPTDCPTESLMDFAY